MKGFFSKIGKQKFIALAAVAMLLVAAIAITVGVTLIRSDNSEEPYTVSNYGTIQGKFTDISINNEENAIEAVRDAAEILGFGNAAEELTVNRTDTVDNLTYYRLDQNYKGIPVYGSSFVVVADENGEALCLSSHANEIDESISITPIVTQEQINSSIAAEFEGISNIEVPEITNDMLVIYVPDNKEATTLAYELYITVGESNYRAIVSAINGECLFSATLDYSNANDEERNIIICNANHTVFECDEKLCKANIVVLNDNTPEANQLYNYLQFAYDYFADVFKINGFNNKNGKTYAIINCLFEKEKNGQTVFYANNAYSNTTFFKNITFLRFGSAKKITIDLVSHEYMHSVEQATSGMIYKGESGAIMEAYSDIFGELIEYCYNDKKCNWVNGDGISARNIENPYITSNPIKYQIFLWQNTDDTSENNDNGGVHKNSTVISHTAYVMTQSDSSFTALTMDELAELWWNALLLITNKNCSFIELRNYMESAAINIGLSEEKQARVSSAFEAANIIYSEENVAKSFEINIINPYDPEFYKKCKIEISGTAQEGWNEKYYEEIIPPKSCISKTLERGIYTITLFDKKTDAIILTRIIKVNKNYKDKNIILYCENAEEITEETIITPETEPVIDTIFSVTHSYNGVTTDIIASSPIKMFNGSATQTWTVTSNCEWMAGTSGSWFTIDKMFGSTGSTQLKITIPKYTLTQNNGAVIFNVNGKEYKVSIYQKANRIGGTVTDVIYPLKNVEVKISNQNYSADTVYTDENGRFSVAVPDGWYTVTLQKEGFEPREISVYCGTGESDDMGIISLDLLGEKVPMFAVTGKVVKFDGVTPYVDATVNIYNDSFATTVSVDASGKFSAFVPNGDYNVAINAPEEIDSRFAVTHGYWDSCHVTDKEINLGTFRISKFLRGMVSEGTPDSEKYGKPLEGVKITVIDSNGNDVSGFVVPSAEYDNSGNNTNYSLSFKSPGSYDLIFTKEGYQDFVLKNYLIGNDTVRINDVSLIRSGIVVIPETTNPEETEPTPETTEHIHDYAETERVASTCTKEGIIKSVCACGETTVSSIPVTDHTFENKICSACGFSISKASEGLEITKYTSYCEIVGIGKCKDEYIVLPDTYQGLPVTMLSDEAFKDCEFIKGIYIPASIIEITGSRFTNSPFRNCPNLKSIEVDPNNTIFHSSGNCLIITERKLLIAGCKNSILPNDGSVKTIGYTAFMGSSIERVIIPDSVTVVGMSAFYKCNNLKYLYLTANSMNTLDAPIFLNRFSSCPIKEVVIADDFTDLEKLDFNTLKSLTVITLGKGISVIKSNDFYRVSELTTLNLNNTIEKIEENAFVSCSNLTAINFNGTLEQWEAINKNNGWDSGIGNYTVYCLDGKIKK